MPDNVVYVLKAEDIPKIYDKVMWRQVNFNDENMVMSLGVVLMNYGDKYVKVECVNGEWAGTKGDLTKHKWVDIPLCPNGHPLFEITKAPRLALVVEEDNA